MIPTAGPPMDMRRNVSAASPAETAPSPHLTISSSRLKTTTAVPSLSSDSPSTTVRRDGWPPVSLRMATTATGSVALTMVPKRNTAGQVQSAAKVSLEKTPVRRVARISPGTARTTTWRRTLRNVCQEMENALSKMSGGRNTKRSRCGLMLAASDTPSPKYPSGPPALSGSPDDDDSLWKTTMPMTNPVTRSTDVCGRGTRCMTCSRTEPRRSAAKTKKMASCPAPT